MEITNETGVQMKRVTLSEIFPENYTMSEAYKTLRTNIQFCGSDMKTIVMTSCEPQEGKSTTVIELSKSLAEVGKKVLIIDADMRKSVMAKKYTKQTGIVGLSQFLSGQANLPDVLMMTQYPNLSIIFAGQFPPNPAELLGRGKFESFLKDAKQIYDYIIVDTPPLGMVIDAAVAASYCDGAVMVIDTDRISYHLAQSVKEQLEKSGCRILGVVVNQVEKKRNRYYKRYYGRYYSYGYRYGSKSEYKAK